MVKSGLQILIIADSDYKSEPAEYESPKGGDKKVKNPNGRGTGWIDRKGRVWVPEDHNGTHAPHWIVRNQKEVDINLYTQSLLLLWIQVLEIE